MTRQYFSDDDFHGHMIQRAYEVIEEFNIFPSYVLERDERPQVYNQSALFLRVLDLPVCRANIDWINGVLETLKVVETAQTAMEKATQIQADLEEFRRINNDAQKQK